MGNGAWNQQQHDVWGMILDALEVQFGRAAAQEEGTFTICSFWLVTALAMIGETKRAYGLGQKLLSFAGPLQLYAEEIDATTGQHLGNFPRPSPTCP